MGQGDLVELIKVINILNQRYLQENNMMSSLLYLLLQAPLSLQRKRDISLHSNGATSNLQQTDKLFMAY
jgi:hypothetical protein